MSIISGGGAVAGSSVAYQIERSLRFNSADSAYLNRTPSTDGNRKVWTWSGWIKRSYVGANISYIFGCQSQSGNDGIASIYFNNDELHTYYDTNGPNPYGRVNTAVYRDTSAWYHIVWAVNAVNTIHYIYVNGVLLSVDSSLYPPNYDYAMNRSGYSHKIGTQAWDTPTIFANFYMTEVHFVDGQALTPSSFGETDTDTGVWKPKAYSGTYGTNGFYLKFADNSGTTAATLGKDSSGNGNNWTPNNFSVTAGAGNDSLVDSPTSYGSDTGAGGQVRGSYCTLNPLHMRGSCTLSDGNLQALIPSGTGGTGTVTGTIGVSSGKYYWEITGTGSANMYVNIGLIATSISASSMTTWGVTGSVAYSYYNGSKYVNGTNSSYGASYTYTDVIGIAIDGDAQTVTFYKNNTSQGVINLPSGYFAWYPAVTTDTGQSNVPFVINFGQRPFAYTAPSGFKALCTANLPTPTIAKGSDYFDVKLYTGNGSTQTISGLNFSPDWVWIKSRNAAHHHRLLDTIRGATKELYSSTTDAETTQSQSLTAFNNDGFSLGSLATVNQSSTTYAAWCWDAASSNSTNTSGTITSTVRANATAGFSIVTYTGTGSAATVGHGLGVAPKMVIVKGRTNAYNWVVWFDGFSTTERLLLDTTDPKTTGNWNTSPTPTVFGLGPHLNINENNITFVAYCFTSVAGYSAFGSYTGNGSSDGPFVFSGFRPRFILIKCSSNGGTNYDWLIIDSARSTYNYQAAWVATNTSSVEGGGIMDQPVDIMANGFKVRASGVNAYPTNTSNYTYIYAAFAESPFKYALAR